MMRILLLLMIPVGVFALVGSVSIDEVDLSNFPSVNVSFRLYDPYGVLDPSLSVDNVRVLENGTELSFELERGLGRFIIVVAVDVSGSMKDILPKLKIFLRNFVRSFSRYDVDIVIVDFGYEREGGIEFHLPINIKRRGGLEIIFRMLDSLKGGGATPLYDAIKASIDFVLRSKGRGVVVVFTDGYDMNYDDSGPGSEISLGELFRFLKSSGVRVYTVGIAGKYYDPPLNDDVLKGIALSSRGVYVKPEEGWIERLMDEVSKGLGVAYRLSFVSKGGTKAVVLIEKNVPDSTETYTASFTIDYPTAVYIPSGYRGILKLDIMNGRILKEKDLGCFVEKVRRFGGKLYAICPSGVSVLDENLNVLNEVRISQVLDVQKFGGKTFFWTRKGLEGYLEGNVITARVFEKIAYVYESSEGEISSFDGLNLKTLFKWRGKVVNFSKIDGKVYFVDYDSGVYEIDGKAPKNVVRASGITSYVGDAYTDGLKGEVVFGRKRVKLPFFPVDTMVFPGRFLVLGWLGEVALFDDEGNLKLLIPAKIRPRLKVVNGEDLILIGGFLYRFEGEDLVKENYDFEIYDVDHGVFSFGDGTILNGKLLDVPSERVGVWRDEVFLYSDGSLKVLEGEKFDLGRELLWVNVSEYGVCVPTSDGILVFKGKKPKFLKIGWVKDCAVSDEVVYTLDEYLNFLTLDGKTVHRVAMPSSAFKVLSFRKKPYVLSLDGRLYSVDKGFPVVIREKCVDVHAYNDGLHILEMEGGKLKIELIR